MKNDMNKIDKITGEAIGIFLALVGVNFDVAGAILYGSRARGTHRVDSDVDLAVLLNGEPANAFLIQKSMSELAYDVLMDTGVNIEPLPIWLVEMDNPETFSNPSLLQSIATEGLRV